MIDDIKHIKYILEDVVHGELRRATNFLLAGIYSRGLRRLGYRPAFVPYQPISFTVSITTRCNLKCEMCLRQLMPPGGYQQPQDMTLATFRKVLGAFPYVKWVTLCGFGEPLLHPNFLEIIEVLKSKRIVVSFTTNGVLLNDKLGRELVRLGVDRVYISVDGATPNTFESIRKGAKFAQVIENARMLSEMRREANKAKPRLIFSFVAMRQNISELPNLVELAHDVGIDAIHSLHVSAYSQRIDTYHLYESDETKALLKKAIKNSKSGIDLILRPLKPTPQSCLMPWLEPYITQDGDVRACCYVGTFDSPTEEWYNGIPISVNPIGHTLGNVLKEDFSDIWNNERYQLFRAELRKFMKEDKNQEWNVERYCDLRRSNPSNYCKVCQFRFGMAC